MGRDKRKGGRVTAKGTRPPYLRPVGGDATPEASPVDSMIDSGGRDLLEESNPIAAETWASGLLEAFESARLQARLDGLEAPPFEEALLHRCRQRRDKRAAAVACALAAVVPPPHDSFASSVAAELQGAVPGLPSWIGAVGRAEPTRGWVSSDVFGDQDSLVIGFRHDRGGGEHALVVLVDHNLSGQAKDAWIGVDFDDVVGTWKANAEPHMRMYEAPVDETLRRLRAAMASSDLWNGDADLRTEDFAQHRALIWARLRRVGLTDGEPSGIDVTRAEHEALVEELMASSHGRELSETLTGVDVEVLVQYILELRSDYGGQPLRWSPTVVAMLLGILAPRKLLLDAGQAAALPAVVRAIVRFSGERTGLDGVFVDETLAAVDEVEREFLDRIGDPAAAGPAKTVLAALEARGVDLTDVGAINDALQQAGPLELPEPLPKKRRPTAAAAPADVVASGAAAPVLARFEALTGFYGDGRKLTQTGQPTLADARELVSLLGTRDQLAKKIGDHTFKTRSAAELPELSFTVRWALAAGAVRKEHGKLRATAAWRKLDGKPLEKWLKAADALPSLGPLEGYFLNHRFRSSGEILDELAAEILAMLAGRSLPFDEVLDWVCDRADIEYEWLAPYMQDPNHRRTSLGWDLDLLARILGWAGIAERVDATDEPDRHDRQRLAGGTLQLTRAGKWWLAER